MQVGFGGFEHELLKKLHYELWNAEIHKIQLALQRQTLKFFSLRASRYFFEISSRQTSYNFFETLKFFSFLPRDFEKIRRFTQLKKNWGFEKVIAGLVARDSKKSKEMHVMKKF